MNAAAEPSISIREYLDLLVRHRRFIILFSLSAMLTALALTYVFSERYQSATTIVYRQQEVTLMKPREHEALGSPASGAPFKIISKTVRDLVDGEALLRPVVLALNLHVESDDHAGKPFVSRIVGQTKDFLKGLRDDAMSLLKYGRIVQEDPVVGAIKNLASNVEVINKDSYVFLVRVRDKNARRSAAIADELGVQLVHYLREQNTQSGFGKRRQIEKLMVEKSAVIDGLSDQIASLLEQHGLVSIPHETERGVERLSDLEKQRVLLENQIAENEARLAVTRRMLGDSQGGTKRYVQPEDKKRLESERVFTELQLGGLRASYRSLERSIAELTTLLQKMPSLELRLARLQTELDGSKRDWVQLRDALQDAVVRSTALQSEAVVLTKASVPTAPVSPVKLYHAGLALLLGLLVSIALVFVLSFFQINLFFNSQAD